MSENKIMAGGLHRKYWSEMDDKERIVKLQEELIRTQRQVSSLSQYMSKLIGHAHLQCRLVSTIENPNCESYGGFSFRVEEFQDR